MSKLRHLPVVTQRLTQAFQLLHCPDRMRRDSHQHMQRRNPRVLHALMLLHTKALSSIQSVPSQDLSSIQCVVNMTFVGQMSSLYKTHSPVIRYCCTCGSSLHIVHYFPDFWTIESSPSTPRTPRAFFNFSSLNSACANDNFALTLTKSTAGECMGDVSEVPDLCQVGVPKLALLLLE
jgi:hypothetical protein